MAGRWLLTGASGQLGGHILQQLVAGGGEKAFLALHGRSGAPGAAQAASIDLSDDAALRSAVRAFRPTHVLHVAALSAVGECHARPDAARRINVLATAALAEEAERVAARLIYTSTDMVFAGDRAPYREADPVRPLSVYGHSKAAGEAAVLGRRGGLVVRLPLMYGLSKTARATTFAQQISALRAGQPLRLFVDEFRTPLWLADAAAALIALAASDRVGLIHVAGPERLSRFDLIARCAALLGLSGQGLTAISRREVDAPEPRPEDLSLSGAAFLSEFSQLAPGPIRPAVFEGATSA